MHAIITGATGLLGRQLVSHLRQRGWTVTALVRPRSDRRPLESLGVVDFYTCDLSRDHLDPEVFRRADVVFHAAAAVRAWASWSYFRENTVNSTERLCAAMASAGCRRLLHISSVAVYGPPRHTQSVGENDQPRRGQHWNYYRRSKARAEEIVWEFHHRNLLRATVLRPAMLYGPGDRTLVGRTIELLRKRKVVFLGNPATPLPLVHAQDVATAAVLTAASDRTIGEAFNVANPEIVTQAQFFNRIAELIGAPLVHRALPYRLAYGAGFTGECLGHLLHTKTQPFLTRYPVFLFGHQRTYSIAKIRTALDWTPQITFEEGIRTTVAWQLQHEPKSLAR